MIEIKKIIKDEIERAIAKLIGEKKIAAGTVPEVIVEKPREELHGDFSVPVAMSLARHFKSSPKVIAKKILEESKFPADTFKKVEIAGPGFINFEVSEHVLFDKMSEILAAGSNYGRCKIGEGKKVLMEIVSANPTGPLHVGHGRGAAVGDALACLLEALGYTVKREYYINDAGNQMENLGKSLQIRYKQLLGEKVDFFDDGYQGEYIIHIAKKLMEEYGSSKSTEGLDFFIDYAYKAILSWIRDDLTGFRINYDTWFSERTLYGKEIDNAIQLLEAKELVCKTDGALCFKSTLFGDEKDRVIIRSDGRPTYFASDIAYHKNKHDRGFDTVINLWGADHHGYIPRMQGVIKALGYPDNFLEVYLFAMVNLMRGDEPLAMSKRAGEFVTFKKLIEEVGVDATRFFFLMRSSDSHMDFDIELAKKHASDNPVYYVQYAHARICSVIKKADENGIKINPDKINWGLLVSQEEKILMRKLLEFPILLYEAGNQRKPHLLTEYIKEVANLFHVFYTEHRVLSDDKELSIARAALSEATRIVIRNLLGVLGIGAPEVM